MSSNLADEQKARIASEKAKRLMANEVDNDANAERKSATDDGDKEADDYSEEYSIKESQ